MIINLLDIQSNTMENVDPSQFKLDFLFRKIPNYKIFPHLGAVRTVGRKRRSPLRSIDSIDPNVVKKPLKRKHSRDTLPLSQEYLNKEKKRMRYIEMMKNDAEREDGSQTIATAVINSLGKVVGGLRHFKMVRP